MTGPSFLPVVEEYLALRRGLGFDDRTLRWLLLDFARYAEQAGHRGPITIDLAVQWASSSRSSDPAYTTHRLSAIRQFARHCAVFEPATQIPPAGLLGRRPGRKQPHIYSDGEIAALLRQTSLLLPRHGLRPKTYVAFFSLLACTGLRLSEARRLATNDVDLDEGVLTVREGKFRKSRVVPLHPNATEALIQYAAHRDACRKAPPSAHFFRTERAPALTHDEVQKTFSRLRHRLGWTAQGRARRPRIHDLRHTVAVRRLLRWYKDGVDVDRKMLALSTYLGHAKVTDTYWYLTAVPELMAIAAKRFECFARADKEDAS